jgi:hypothetical protein
MELASFNGCFGGSLPFILYHGKYLKWTCPSSKLDKTINHLKENFQNVFWMKSEQCRPWSDGTLVPVELGSVLVGCIETVAASRISVKLLKVVDSIYVSDIEASVLMSMSPSTCLNRTQSFKIDNTVYSLKFKIFGKA